MNSGSVPFTEPWLIHPIIWCPREACNIELGDKYLIYQNLTWAFFPELWSNDRKDGMPLLQKEEYWLLQSVKFLLAHFPGSKHHFHVLLFLSHPSDHLMLRFTGFRPRQNCQTVFLSLFPSTPNPIPIYILCISFSPRPGPAEIMPLSHTPERTVFELSLLKLSCWYCGATSPPAGKWVTFTSAHISHSVSTPQQSPFRLLNRTIL